MPVAEPEKNSPMGADSVSELVSLESQYDVFRFMKRVTESWGMKAFMVMNLPMQMSLTLSQCTVITSWPADLLQQYDNDGLLVDSNVYSALKKASAPFVVNQDFIGHGLRPAVADKFKDLFARFNMVNSVWCPVQDMTGMRGAVSLSGSRSSFAPSEIAEIFYLAAHIYGHLAHVRSLDSRISEALTDREIDCLNWTAAGKTSAEIAEILTLSEHTVNHYLNRATKKLDTVNRTQAVAKALRVGLIK
ncbi:helix-turn-helix transcriptional regulator [Agrobacterium larrymoorei]|uniref:helix-turn-helix transcriptional regulator n=1 Tax=Agrobacterium larrymoorei TaxID=160699 RepID=UPI0030BFBD8B